MMKDFSPCSAYQSLKARRGVLVLTLMFAAAGQARATDIVVSGDSSTPVILNPADTLSVLSGANLYVGGTAYAVEGNGPGVATITNGGTISQTGSKRAIYSDNDGSGFNLQNLQGGVITSIGSDVMKMSNGDSVYIINNQGLISQDGPYEGTGNGQALDLRDIDNSVGNSIINGASSNTGARIQANGDDAIRPGSNTKILNYGTITTTGVVNTRCPDYLGSTCDGAPSAHDAIDVGDSTNVYIENYGVISGSRHSITADGDIYVINRSEGLIVGRNGSGVGSDGDGTVVNYGTIRGDYAGAGNAYEFASGTDTTSNNGDGDGVDIDGIARIDNYGTIIGTDAGGFDNNGLPNGAEGIAAGGGIINNRKGALIQGAKNGILVDDGSGGSGVGPTTVINAGTIAGQTYGIGLVGSFANTIINSGTISAEAFAIQTGGSSDTLEIHQGSIIIGAINLGGGGDVIRFLGGNNRLTFSAGNLSSAIVTAQSLPYAVSGDTVATFDPTALSAQDELLDDLTRVIADGLDQRLATARLGHMGGAQVMNGSVVMPTADVPGEAGSRTVFWASVLGQTRNQNAQGSYTGFDTRLGGVMMGGDTELNANLRAGGFLGGSTSTIDTDTNSQSIDADSYFGGIYAGMQKGAPFLNLALTAGLSSQSSDRTINDNLAEGGTDHAKADYNGLFISPAATLGADIAVPGAVLSPSIRARYAALFLDSYAENGSAADLSVDSRSVQIFDLRGQLALAVPVELDGGTLSVTTRLGADATFTSDSDVNAQLLGETLDFTVGGNDMVQGFAGLDIAYTTMAGTRFFAGTEFGIQSEAATTAQATAGIELPL